MGKSSNLKNVNLINQIEQISKKSARSSLNPDNIKGISNELAILSEFLQITSVQAILFSSIVELSLINRTNIETLSKHFKCSPLKVLGMMDDIEVLIQKGYVRKIIQTKHAERSFNDINFSVPNTIIQRIQKKDQKKLIKKTKLDLPKFLEKVFKLSIERENELISTLQFIADSEELIQMNIELRFVKYINNHLLKAIDKCFVFLLSYSYLKGETEFDLAELAEKIFDDISDQFTFQQELIRGHHRLITKEFISVMHNEFMGGNYVKITDKVISNMFEGHKEIRIQDYNSSLLIKPDGIKSCKLFFNPCLQNEIHKIQKTLSNSKFNNIKRQLEQRKFNSGLTILLYGYSGTGKTEAVYQIAKKTNREIMMVDLSKTKSMWFGESEKQVKKIFDDYKLAIRNAKVAPILFINEVDGLLTKRQDIGNNSTSALHALNTIQNILLQEMESFDGILFATTNLTENLDKAFDRRFLFKLKFKHPDVETSQKIWKNKLPELSSNQVKSLCHKHELTGGQIENVIRQTLLVQMVDDKLDIFDTLNKNCMNETGYNTIKKVGF